MNECKPVSTPTNSDIKPASASLEDVCNQKEYQAVVGSLLYLSTKDPTRYFVCCGQYSFLCQSKPRTLDSSKENSAISERDSQPWFGIQREWFN